MDWNIIQHDREQLDGLLGMLLSIKEGLRGMAIYNTIDGEGKILGIIILDKKLKIADLSEIEESVNMEINMIKRALQRLDKEEGLNERKST